MATEQQKIEAVQLALRHLDAPEVSDMLKGMISENGELTATFRSMTLFEFLSTVKVGTVLDLIEAARKL